MPWRLNPNVDCYAVMDGGKWYGVVVYLRDGKHSEEKLVLSDHPAHNAMDALRYARKYASEHPR
jgi:hypothetical protein